jgi:hypothetical protein
VASTLGRVAVTAGDAGDINLKRDILERALLLQQRLFGPLHPEVGCTLTNLGAAYV